MRETERETAIRERERSQTDRQKKGKQSEDESLRERERDPKTETVIRGEKARRQTGIKDRQRRKERDGEKKENAWELEKY